MPSQLPVVSGQASALLAVPGTEWGTYMPQRIVTKTTTPMCSDALHIEKLDKCWRPSLSLQVLVKLISCSLVINGSNSTKKISQHINGIVFSLHVRYGQIKNLEPVAPKGGVHMYKNAPASKARLCVEGSWVDMCVSEHSGDGIACSNYVQTSPPLLLWLKRLLEWRVRSILVEEMMQHYSVWLNEVQMTNHNSNSSWYLY